jgi:sigma54-dependent transcription regulator
MGFLSLFGNYFPYVWSVIKAFGTRFVHETQLLVLLTLCIAAFLCWFLVAMHCRQVVEVVEVVQARKQDDPVCTTNHQSVSLALNRDFAKFSSFCTFKFDIE